jgi:hypothetical protein
VIDESSRNTNTTSTTYIDIAHRRYGMIQTAPPARLHSSRNPISSLSNIQPSPNKTNPITDPPKTNTKASHDFPPPLSNPLPLGARSRRLGTQALSFGLQRQRANEPPLATWRASNHGKQRQLYHAGFKGAVNGDNESCSL